MGSIYIAGNRIVPAPGYVASPFGHLQLVHATSSNSFVEIEVQGDTDNYLNPFSVNWVFQPTDEDQ